MKTIAVIPARYASSRMPGKPLADILGKPMIWWVYKEAEKCAALDGLMDQAAQDAMFKAVAEKYADGPLFVKTHPRDETDYAALFPGATILSRTMPSEVLNFCLPGKFKRAVTVQSWVLRGFEAAEETVFLTLEEAKGLAGV